MTTTYMSPRLGNITLSRGANSAYQIRAEMSAPFPTDATCYVQFIDTNGDDVGSPIPGAVFVDRCQWLFDPADVDIVMRGMNFEAFLVLSDGTKFKLRYGKVIRREATFEYSTVSKTQPALYSDDFTGRSGQPGNQYAMVYGNATIHSNTLQLTPNGLGPNISLLFPIVGVRVNRALATDSVRMQITAISAGAGKLTVGICGNTGMTSYLGFQLDAGLLGDNVRAVQGTGPVNQELLGPTYAGQIATGNVYIVDYNDDTKTMQVWLNSDLSAPILEWVDEDNVIPHGQGYRYPVFSWDGSLLATGPQVQKWEALDYVGA